MNVSHFMAVIFYTEFDAISVYSVSYKYSYRTGSPFGHRYTEFPDPARTSGLTRSDWPGW